MKIGFVGLGCMGKELALNLLKAGNELTVYDLSKEAIDGLVSAGAKGAKSPKEVAETAEMVCTSLPGPPQIEAVVLGGNGTLAAQKAGGLYIDFSTSSPSLMKKIAALAKEKNIGVLDAPLATGGPAQVADKTIVALVGAEKKVLEKCRKVLEATTGQIVHVGDVGSGMSLKVINNMAGGIIWNLYAECLGLAAKYDIPIKLIFDRIAALGYVYKWVAAKALVGDTDNPNFAIELMAKDVKLAVDMAYEGNVPVPVASAALQRYVEAKAKGWGRKDVTGVLCLYEELLHTKIRLE